MSPRKSADERRAAEERAEYMAQRRFYALFEAISDFREAWSFCNQGPLESEPGGTLYTHLGQFLHNFDDIPRQADANERASYLAFLRRLQAAGRLADGVLARLEPLLSTPVGRR